MLVEYRFGEPADVSVRVDPTATTPTPKATAVISASENAVDHTAVVADATKRGTVVADAPKRGSGTTKKMAESLDIAKKAVKGHTNARNLLFAAAASVVGVGLYKKNRQTRIEPDEQYYER
jgi:hypothetical protein